MCKCPGQLVENMKSHQFVAIVTYFVVIDITSTEEGFCSRDDATGCTEAQRSSLLDPGHTSEQVSSESNDDTSRVASAKPAEIFLFYDVNQGEGFNLRRDVYIRMAVFLNHLVKQPDYESARLVLPPFYRLYHWKSRFGTDEAVFWNHFFNMEHLKAYANVIDLWEYFEIMETKATQNGTPEKKYQIDHVIKLRHFDSMFASGKFEDKFEFGKCPEAGSKAPDTYHDFYTNFSMLNSYCVEFQGGASLLHEVLNELPRR